MRNSRPPAHSLQAVITGLPIVTAALYLFGVVFYQGFMRRMGLEESQFPLTVDRTIFNGLFALLDLSAPQLINFILATEIFTLVTFIIVFISTSVRVRSFFKKVPLSLPENTTSEAKLSPPAPITEIANFAAKALALCLIVVFVILGILAASYFTDKSGQDVADAFIHKAEAGVRSPIELYLSGKSEPITAHIIVCSASHCAYLINGQAITYRNDQIEKTIATNITAHKGATDYDPAKSAATTHNH